MKTAKQFIAVDLYNQEVTYDIAVTITSAVGGVNTSGAKMVEIINKDGDKS